MDECNRSSKIQMEFWRGKFGNEYTERNIRDACRTDELSLKTLGVSRTALFTEMLSAAQPHTVLEVGCSAGQNFPFLLSLSPELKLYAIEINPVAIQLAHKHYHTVGLVQGSVFTLPFRDNSFDLVFTAGVLIHIHPSDLKRVLCEIWRVCRNYVFGLEHHSDNVEHVVYRGHKNRFWKQDFEKAYHNCFSNTKTVYSKVYAYSEEVGRRQGLFTKVFLVQKT
ncbi:hypothetical protein ES703_36294 [subsurface metagenome]